tara:strand:- start:47332 stop:47754 length:423 start_codon:yes stop_codon:yes gene_type:complete
MPNKQNNNYTKEIYYGDTHVATIVKPKMAKPGLSFVTNDEKFLQLGIWNYPKNTSLDNHFHNWFKRESYRTSEFVFVLKGKIKCNLYTEEGEFIDSLIIKKNEGIIQHNFAHEYIILKKSIILESKNGPFLGVEKDKTLL